jgi:hypothetical protein
MPHTQNLIALKAFNWTLQRVYMWIYINTFSSDECTYVLKVSKLKLPKYNFKSYNVYLKL